jgi:hypothetical protein
MSRARFTLTDRRLQVLRLVEALGEVSDEDYEHERIWTDNRHQALALREAGLLAFNGESTTLTPEGQDALDAVDAATASEAFNCVTQFAVCVDACDVEDQRQIGLWE